MIVAIQPDYYGGRGTARLDASSGRWASALERAGHTIRWVEVTHPDILRHLRGCDAFLWRHGHLSAMRQIVKRLLPIVERELGIAVLPNQRTCWHFDDKIAQQYLFDAWRLPTPRTAILWGRDADLTAALARTGLPAVLKLWSGAGSTNVRLVHTPEDARDWFDRLMARGVFALDDHGNRPGPQFWDYHRDYLLLQEFLADNPFDTRVTVIGRRVFAFRRMNRDGDFRASGSGRIDHDPAVIHPQALRLACAAATAAGSQSLAVDVLRRGSEHVIGEMSYTFTTWAVHECPGHWEVVAPDELEWREGQMWPEDAQVEDLLASLPQRGKAGRRTDDAA